MRVDQSEKYPACLTYCIGNLDRFAKGKKIVFNVKSQEHINKGQKLVVLWARRDINVLVEF